MKYLNGKRFTFTGLADRGNQARCEANCREWGHTMPDRQGKCLRCSVKVRHATNPQWSTTTDDAGNRLTRAAFDEAVQSIWDEANE